MADLVVTEVSVEEVQRALLAYRAFNGGRAKAIVLQGIQELISCPPCLKYCLQPGDDEDQIRDQLREIHERLQFGA